MTTKDDTCKCFFNNGIYQICDECRAMTELIFNELDEEDSDIDYDFIMSDDEGETDDSDIDLINDG